MIYPGRRVLLGFAALAACVIGSAAPGQDRAADGGPQPSVWDLPLGAHAEELPDRQFADWACGTNGGPPSLPLDHWRDHRRCRAEAGTGWHEVYFEYDDEQEYLARAMRDEVRTALYGNTSVYSRPVIASALFDGDGFMRGLRLVTDPRVDLGTRELAHTLGGFLEARHDGWDCENLPAREGESAYQGMFIKRRCELMSEDGTVQRVIETHLFRRAGQQAIDPVSNLPTEGYFESLTRYEEFLVGEIEDREARLAAIGALPAREADPLLQRAMNCPGCDLAGARLKRADLRGANLAGADLRGATLHGANLAGANLDGARLEGANLNRARLTRATLAGADLAGAFLHEAQLDGADLSEATLTRVRAGQSRWVSANLSGATFAESDLSHVRMTGVTAPGASFAGSRLWDAQLSRSNFDEADFGNADMLRVVMSAVSAVGANLQVTNLFEADLRNSDFRKADFSGSRLSSAILAGSELDDARFEGVTGFTPPLTAGGGDR